MSKGTVSSSQLALLKAGGPSRVATFGLGPPAPSCHGSASRLAAGATQTAGVFMTAQCELVRGIDRYLIAAGSRPVHIAELCETFDVSRRTLHRAFMDVLSIPPIAYLRRKRLDEVRAALLMADLGATVADLARAHGFLELGRFAGTYRRTFGELPSQTLQRSRRHDAARRGRTRR